MTTRAPVHPPLTPGPPPAIGRGVAGPGPLQRAGRGEVLLAVFTARPFLITLALAALWVVLSAALAFVAQRVFGMDAPAAWAYAIGIVSYMYLFTGFVVGLIYLVRRDGEHVDGT